MNKDKCKGCQWHNKPCWSIISPCENCPRENLDYVEIPKTVNYMITDMLKDIKTNEELKKENKELKKINEEHRKLNGELREENKKLQDRISELERNWKNLKETLKKHINDYEKFVDDEDVQVSIIEDKVILLIIENIFDKGEEND